MTFSASGGPFLFHFFLTENTKSTARLRLYCLFYPVLVVLVVVVVTSRKWKGSYRHHDASSLLPFYISFFHSLVRSFPS